MRLGFLGRTGPPDDRLWLRKIRSWEELMLFSFKRALSEWQNPKLFPFQSRQIIKKEPGYDI